MLCHCHSTNAEDKEFVVQQCENVSKTWLCWFTNRIFFHLTAYFKADRAAEVAEQHSIKSRHVQNCYHQMQHFWPKCTKFNVGWGSIPRQGSSQRSSRSPSWLRMGTALHRPHPIVAYPMSKLCRRPCVYHYSTKCELIVCVHRML